MLKQTGIKPREIKMDSVSKGGIDLFSLPNCDELIDAVSRRCVGWEVYGEVSPSTPYKFHVNKKNVGIRILSIERREDGIYGRCVSAGPHGRNLLVEYGINNNDFTLRPRILGRGEGEQREHHTILTWDVYPKEQV